MCEDCHNGTPDHLGYEWWCHACRRIILQSDVVKVEGDSDAGSPPYFYHKGCGAEVFLSEVCAACGEAIEVRIVDVFGGEREVRVCGCPCDLD